MSKCLSPILILLISVLVNISCQKSPEKITRPEIIEKYYAVLNDSEFQQLDDLFFDSVRVSEGDYHSVFSVDKYHNWLSWDSVFNPGYEILEMKEVNGAIEVTVSKSCKRVLFLNEKPLTSIHRFEFKENQIFNTEVVSYLTMDDEKWSSNRANLVSWVKENRPDLDGFLHDQTKTGALNYITAMEAYKQREHSN